LCSASAVLSLSRGSEPQPASAAAASTTIKRLDIGADHASSARI
jgi:hypothetical protein